MKSQLDKYFTKLKEPVRPEAPHLRHQGKVETNLPKPFKFMQDEPPKKPSLFVVVDTTPKRITRKAIARGARKASLDNILKNNGYKPSTQLKIQMRDIPIVEYTMPRKPQENHNSPRYN